MKELFVGVALAAIAAIVVPAFAQTGGSKQPPSIEQSQRVQN